MTRKIVSVEITETIHTAGGEYEDTRTVLVSMPADYDPELVTLEDIALDDALTIVDDEVVYTVTNESYDPCPAESYTLAELYQLARHWGVPMFTIRNGVVYDHCGEVVGEVAR